MPPALCRRRFREDRHRGRAVNGPARGTTARACSLGPSIGLARHPASSSLTASSMNLASSGLNIGLPARWPQIDGIGRNSAFWHAGDLAAVVLDGKVEVGLARHHDRLGLDRAERLGEIAAVKLVGADVGVLPHPQHRQKIVGVAAAETRPPSCRRENPPATKTQSGATPPRGRTPGKAPSRHRPGRTPETRAPAGWRTSHPARPGRRRAPPSPLRERRNYAARSWPTRRSGRSARPGPGTARPSGTPAARPSRSRRRGGPARCRTPHCSRRCCTRTLSVMVKCG